MTDTTNAVNEQSTILALLSEMRAYSIKRITENNLPPFKPSEEALEVYQNISSLDLLGYENSSVIQNLQSEATKSGHDYATYAKALSSDSAKLVEKVTSEENAEEALAQLRKDREKNLETAKNTINTMYDRFESTVKTNPKLAKPILKVSKIFTDGFDYIVKKIREFVNYVLSNIVEAAKKIWSLIKETYSLITGVIGGWFTSRFLNKIVSEQLNISNVLPDIFKLYY